VFVISTLGALNGSLMALSRIPFAMARDGLFCRAFGNVGSHAHTPIRAILAQAIWACVLAMSSTF
jgi:APA family basic amino acid/polyamine antiporter